ncbi:Xaa-Pro peptidase family protein [bacterium]|nr:Xaa-Pro peptidase family protein [bacterium]
MTDHGTPPPLNPDSCRERQEKLRSLCRSLDLDGAFFWNRFYVYALTGYWHAPPLTETAVWVPVEGDVVIASHDETPFAPAADQVLSYKPNDLFTLRENQSACVMEVMNPVLAGAKNVGVDWTTPAALVEGPACRDISFEYQHLRRSKDQDEIDALKFTIDCADKAYAAGREFIQPGVSEIDIMSTMRGAAERAAGEILSGFGQDYKAGCPGGFAERRAVESGQLICLDVGIGVRGYRSDLCRTFSIDGNTTDAQLEAHARVMEAMNHAKSRIAPGVSCTEVFREVETMLDGWNGCAFFHHLGHGIGLDAHEVPRINPGWDDVFEIGDVVAVEPGLYSDELNGGIRLENNFWITENGLEQLSDFPMEL